MSALYLIGLLVALTGMVVLDLRFRLFFGTAPVRAAITLVLGVAFFLAWDAAGIGLGIFFRGTTSLLVGLQLAPELPLEELFFLTLLCYLTMNVYGALVGWSSSRRDRRIEPTTR
ncbi:MAG TPA: lycopene cyclase domain-containing protein [Pseudolysinimonas sp.]|nr:lycopene cyclase domain-containing protein [Pseudolysinimonas sp.]